MSIRKIKRRHVRSMRGPIERITLSGEALAYVRALPNDAARHDFVRTALRHYVNRSHHG